MFTKIALLTVSLQVWRLHAVDRADHNHTHCKFLSKKYVWYILYCYPKLKGKNSIIVQNLDFTYIYIVTLELYRPDVKICLLYLVRYLQYILYHQ